MQDQAEPSVLRRKTSMLRAGPGLAVMTPARALRIAIARAGDSALDCPVSLGALSDAIVAPEDLVAALPVPALIGRLDGPDGSRGLAVASPQVVGAVIEALTMGRVLSRAAPDRPATNTDAAMLAGFLDQVLDGFALLAGNCPDPLPVAGFSFARPLPDGRSAGMELRDVPHLRFQAELVFADGAKTGTLQLVFPARAVTSAAQVPTSKRWHDALQRSVLNSGTRLQAILCRPSLPIARVSALSVGDVLELPEATVESIILAGPDGSKVIGARLGRSGSMRAVRVAIGPASSTPRPIGGPDPAAPDEGRNGDGIAALPAR